MKSIRPLVTITILTVVGVFLYRQLNEGPQLDESANSEWSVPAGVPGLQTGQSTDQRAALSPPEATGEAVSSAPTWAPPVAGDPPAAAPGQPPTGVEESARVPPVAAQPATRAATAADQQAELPEVPNVPDLPPLSVSSQTESPGTAAAMPQNVPVARYPDQAPAAEQAGGGQVAVPVQPVPAQPVAAGQQASGSGERPVAVASGTDPAAGETTPGEAATAAAGGDPSMTTPLVAAPDDLAGESYATIKPMIQAALSQGDLNRAHLMLSQCYGNETLTPAEQEEITNLLSQLAGTVIYSTEHRLEPAYTVQPGDTLETIARQYEVPWQLLAKINGIAGPDAVQSGQQLKVVRGPFMGVVDLSTGELALVLDGRYAGRFAVNVPPAAKVGEGEWVVENKLVVPGEGAPSGQEATAQDRVLVLKSSSPTASEQALTLGSGSSSAAGAAATKIEVGAQDAEELNDILSVGSRIVIRR